MVTVKTIIELSQRGLPLRWRLRRPVRTAAACILGFCATVTTADSREGLGTPLFRFSGFATLGAVYNDSDEVDFVRDLSQSSGPRGEWSTLPDTILGGQVNIQPHEHWQAVLQVVSRYDYTSNYDPRLTWGFLKYEPDPAFSFRIGRVGFDAYMEGDSRNVGYSFLTVRQPIEYFGSLELTYFDGVDAVYKRPVGTGLLTAKVFAGIADEKLATSRGNFDLDNSKLAGGYLAYEWWNWRVRVGASSVKLENASDGLAPLLTFLRASGPAASNLADEIALEGGRVNNTNVGIAYDRGSFQGSLSYNRREADTRSLADADSLYALAGIRIGHITPYTGYVYTDAKSTRTSLGSPVDSLTESVFVNGLLEQRSWLLGVRYDFANNMDLKFQLDVIEAREPEGSYLQEEAPSWDGDAVIFSLALDAVF